MAVLFGLVLGGVQEAGEAVEAVADDEQDDEDPEPSEEDPEPSEEETEGQAEEDTGSNATDDNDVADPSDSATPSPPTSPEPEPEPQPAPAPAPAEPAPAPAPAPAEPAPAPGPAPAEPEPQPAPAPAPAEPAPARPAPSDERSSGQPTAPNRGSGAEGADPAPSSGDPSRGTVSLPSVLPATPLRGLLQDSEDDLGPTVPDVSSNPPGNNSPTGSPSPGASGDVSAPGADGSVEEMPDEDGLDGVEGTSGSPEANDGSSTAASGDRLASETTSSEGLAGPSLLGMLTLALGLLALALAGTATVRSLRPGWGQGGNARTRTDDGLDEPFGSPSHGLSAMIARVAGESDVEPRVLEEAAGGVHARTVATEAAERQASSQARSRARLVAGGLPVLPLGVAAFLFLGSDQPLGVMGWALLGLAGALVVLGVRWAERLPDSPARLLLERERLLGDRLHWIDQVSHTLDTAELYAAAGVDGRAALDAAAPPYMAHPVRQALEATDGGDPPPPGLEAYPLAPLVDALDEASSSAAAQELLRRCSAQLRAHHRTELRQRARWVYLGALGPLVACFLPATAIVVAAFTL